MLLITIGMTCPTRSADYASPDLGSYYATLKQPDNPTISCCGDSDAYYADRTETDPVTGGLVAIITDTRPDTRLLPDGRKIIRLHIPPGTRIAVPASKIRKHPIPNPTGHTIIFISYGVNVLCYEPLPLI